MITVGWLERYKAEAHVIKIPFWRLPMSPQICALREIGTVPHWRNEAAKRKCGGDKSKASSKQFVQVRRYAGLTCQLRRALNSKDYRKQAEAAA